MRDSVAYFTGNRIGGASHAPRAAGRRRSIPNGNALSIYPQRSCPYHWRLNPNSINGSSQ
jgi:hypothetical protein